eukprot:3902311-Pyramimonas_sp.AAC.1
MRALQSAARNARLDGSGGPALQPWNVVHGRAKLKVGKVAGNHGALPQIHKTLPTLCVKEFWQLFNDRPSDPWSHDPDS